MARRIVANNLLLDEASEFVAEGREVCVPTKGNSMLPFIVGGRDTVVLSRARRVDVGDILLVKINGHYIIHRVRAIVGSHITLMGDGNVRGCEQCTFADVRAKVITINHNGKAVDCSTSGFRFQSKLWRMLLPLRRYILGVWRRTPFWPC
ncbi:MAG: S24/S26 family peptidase [Rikenellaceae bacterium]